MKNVWSGDEFRWQLREPYRLPHLVFQNIKYSWQRITKGYCDKDLWNIDGWFMDIMPNMLQQFKENRHGSPGILGTDYVNADGIRCNDTCHQEWDEILDKMIFLFREMNEETCQKKNPMRLKENWKNIGRIVKIGHSHYLQNGFIIYGISKLESKKAKQKVIIFDKK